MPDSAFAPQSPFAGLPLAAAAGGGVLVSDRDGLGLAAVLVRKGRLAALGARLRDRFGIELPDGPRRMAAGEIAFAGTSPGAWLATCENGANSFAASLEEALGGLASVSDQSDGYAVLRLTGQGLRQALVRLVPIDVHPRMFRPGDVAATVAAHIGVTFWRLEDGADGAPVFEIAVFRSLAKSLWHAIGESAAQCALVQPLERGDGPRTSPPGR